MQKDKNDRPSDSGVRVRFTDFLLNTFAVDTLKAIASDWPTSEQRDKILKIADNIIEQAWEAYRYPRFMSKYAALGYPLSMTVQLRRGIPSRQSIEDAIVFDDLLAKIFEKVPDIDEKFRSNVEMLKETDNYRNLVSYSREYMQARDKSVEI